MAEDWNKDWVEAELRALRDIVEVQKEHVAQRFTQVNELREQVLQERGVFVRHEALMAVSDRVAKIEQSFITRGEFDAARGRIGKLEALGPLIVLVAGVIGSVIGMVAYRLLFPTGGG